ncbi:UNVERIFIED_CONTAM: hypothetical protein K2H54_044952 [Gekko kuhli]
MSGNGTLTIMSGGAPNTMALTVPVMTPITTGTGTPVTTPVTIVGNPVDDGWTWGSGNYRTSYHRKHPHSCAIRLVRSKMDRVQETEYDNADNTGNTEMGPMPARKVMVLKQSPSNKEAEDK